MWTPCGITRPAAAGPLRSTRRAERPPRAGDLVEAEAAVAGRALERREPVLAVLVLGDGEGDALLSRVRERAIAELGAEAGVGAEHRRRAGEHADEVGELASARQGALQDRDAPLGGGELIVDLEPALLSLHRFLFPLILTGGKYRREK